MADNEEKDTQNEKSKGNNFFVRLCYGVVGRYKDTSKMSTPEVIDEFLKNRGYNSIKDFFKNFKSKKKKSDLANTQSNSLSYNTLKSKTLEDSRVNYTRIVSKERLNTAFDRADKKVAETTLELFLDDSFGIGDKIFENGNYFSPAFNKVCLNITAFEPDDFSNPGETVFHELWHAIDNNYGVRIKNEKEHAVSCSFVLSTGYTFSETLAREWASKIKIDELRADRDNEVNQYYTDKGFDVAKITETFKALDKKASDAYIETMRATSFNSKSAENARQKIINSTEYQKAKKDYNLISKPPVEINRKWGNISDFISGATNGNEHFGYGHSKKYWKKTSDNRFLEAFAEIAASKATNQESYNLIQRYLPETVAAFEEIYDKLKNGEIKSNGRIKYTP